MPSKSQTPTQNKTYNCSTCKQNITSVRKPGIQCIGCKKSYHYTCVKIDSPEEKQKYVTSEKIFLCANCSRAHRQSIGNISIVNVTITSPNTSRKSSNQPINKPPITTGSNTTKDLERTIKELQEALASLTEQLKAAREDIQLLKNQISSAPKYNSAAESEAKTKSVFFTVNGIPESDGEDVRNTVETVIGAKAGSFCLDETTEVRRLASKSNNHHAILIVVKLGSTQYDALLKARGHQRGADLGLNCGSVYVNESVSSGTYQLFKAAKQLKQKGYQFIWLRENKVFARRAKGSNRIHIKDDGVLKTLISR